ncbi:hypothetical protein E0Z10_g753 [Xylaria hypoxylon]|uniref:Gamma-glutamylcyclotransferase AIG2-like domain-containing protein n=1 Tax=Xylaria hypoxylon TaxID=37992 RepID=A0A4Z0Z726_9PEZI|nr:hypothetical protein E0Z10_g753 [Xylaria hypoxylon]
MASTKFPLKTTHFHRASYVVGHVYTSQKSTKKPREPYPPLFTPPTFKPCYMFIYGTLMDPDVLQYITREVSGEGDAQTGESESTIKIHGMFWQVEDYQHFWVLQQYETSAYRERWCQIHVEDNSEVLEGSVVFVWAKKPQNPDLMDGVFDLTKWQKTDKPSLFTTNKEHGPGRELDYLH